MEEHEQVGATIQLPEQASTLAPHVDSLYYDIFWISVAFFVAIVAAMTLFAYLYRRRPGQKAKPPGHHNALELFWTFSPLILLAYMFHQGFEGFMFMSTPPPNAINIRVTAYKWRWQFEQPNGMTEGELRVPVHRPVRLIMGSAPSSPGEIAVLHSFFVPAFRVKRDVVPGMFTSLWFEATRTGDFQIYCTEYCGSGHSGMLSTVHVMEQDDYAEFLRVGPSCPPEHQEDWQWGQQLFANNGCPACHHVDAALGASVGPNLANVVGTEQPLEGGRTAMADAAYVAAALQQPQQDIVRGFTSAAMPSYASLPQSQLDAIISYLAHLSPEHESSVEVEQHCGQR
ncbi:MAG: cytochrome c oxidase subunit II [Sandaracinaceae bacterium]|nr:cytochrome c oxidase subunit II [Sandaracinaceae bacterium]